MQAKLYKLKRLFLSSVSNKFLAVFILCLIIPLIILFQFFSYGFHSVLIEKEEQYTSEKIRFVTTEISNIFEEMDSIITSLILDTKVTDILLASEEAPSYPWFEDYKTLNNTLSLLAYNANNQYGITVISKNNTLYQTAAVHNNNLKITSPIFQYIESGNGRLLVFNRMLSGFDTNEMLCLGRAIYQNQQLLGVILVEVAVSTLDNILNPLENPNTHMYLLQNTKDVLYDTAFHNQATIPAELEQSLKKGRSSVSLENTDYLLMQQTIAKLPLSVVALVTTESVFHDSSILLTLFITAFVFIIGFTIIGIFLLTRFFTKDITSLSKEVAAFGRNPDNIINVPIHSEDEVGRLTEGFIAMSNRINLLLEQIRNNEKNKRILEFQALQAQINPHMIYNTLNTITYLAELQNVENIQEVSSSFAALLRSLSNVQGEYLTISQEIDYLKAYISIKKYNLLSDIEIDFQVDSLANDYYILKLILQPIVENAMIHGLCDQLEGGLIVIKVTMINQFIHIDITDNGRGMTKASIEKVTTGQLHTDNTFLRVGIHNIMERLNLQYNGNYHFEITSESQMGTTVHLDFPAINTKEDHYDHFVSCG